MDKDDVLDKYSVDHLSTKDFKRLSRFIGDKIGIKMPEVKKGMVESRLRKRLRALKIETYHDYCTYLFSPDGMAQELNAFINVITTNKTDFFREPEHFSFLADYALPDILLSCNDVGERKVRIWSSACSRGAEPYTIAMVVAHFQASDFKFDFSILATDISTEVLDIARKGIYSGQDIAPISLTYRKRYLLRSKDRKKDLFRIIPELRSRVTFARLNLITDDYRLSDKMDIIFCRNVIIYFSKETQDRLMVRLCGQLRSGGYLFMGHSELLDCRKLPLVSVAPTIYRKT